MIDKVKEKKDNRFKFLQGQSENLTINQEFHLLLKRLRQQFAPDYPVKVRRISHPYLNHHGYCRLANADKPKRERYYMIVINKDDDWSTQTHTILHEWAHTLAWHLVENGKDHGDIYHRYFGNIYRALIED